MTTQPDPTTLFKKYGYEEMKSSLLEWLNPGEETETPAEEPAKAPAAEAPKAPGYSLNAKPKVDIDKAFDDLFTEESNDLPF